MLTLLAAGKNSVLSRIKAAEIEVTEAASSFPSLTFLKIKRSRKDPFILDQIWFIFDKVTNYVKIITPDLVSLKIGALFLV